MGYKILQKYASGCATRVLQRMLQILPFGKKHK